MSKRIAVLEAAFGAGEIRCAERLYVGLRDALPGHGAMVAVIDCLNSLGRNSPLSPKESLLHHEGTT
jgi:hypothetical protein